jgi:hypothetical protein
MGILGGCGEDHAEAIARTLVGVTSTVNTQN